MTPVDWQTPLTILLAGACAVFLLFGWLRPFFSRVAGACGACPSCGPGDEGENHGEPGLLQIDADDAEGPGKGGPSRRIP